MIPVILSGGSGTRLWPVSRTKLPKQFCEIFEQSLHITTIKRLLSFGSPWIITGQSLRDLTLRDAKTFSIPPSQIVLEPMSRNTAPAIALICHLFELSKKEDALLGIFPADHLIENESEFQKTINLAVSAAEKGQIVTLGIKPNYPATGYGYIQTSTPNAPSTSNATNPDATKHSILSVQKFHEKPHYDLAQEFLKAGNFFWNAGIFVFKVSTMIKALQQYQPNLWSHLTKVKADLSNLNTIYAQVENISIDYAIMEKLSPSQLSCIPCDAGWNDVGSWDAIEEIMQTRPQNSISKVEVQSQNNFIHSHLNKQYAFIGVNDLIVVDTADATLIARKGSTQMVKEVVESIKTSSPQLTKEHTFDIRPWGQYEILKDRKHFKSKVIQVLPGEQISYQSHSKREEHWIITQGSGEVILDEKIIPASVGAYIKIPLGSKHRIRNTSEQCLEFVEVQLGTYFGEDDIIRFQDDYQRISDFSEK